MKKYLIITMAIGFILTSCKKSDILPPAYDVATAKSAPLPATACEVYRIYNDYAATGSRLMYEFTDCGGIDRRGFIDPAHMIIIVARPGTVSCPGGNIIPHQN